jgi:hypothetical protein
VEPGCGARIPRIQHFEDNTIGGTFIIVGADGGLATLAGNGRFTSAGQSNPANLALVEHLRIT